MAGMGLPSMSAGVDGKPPAGIVFGPHPPCSVCGSDGFPADLELSVKGRDAWLCVDCYTLHIPEAVQRARPVDRQKVMVLRRTEWSRSWRGWRRRGREEAEQPGLLLP